MGLWRAGLSRQIVGCSGVLADLLVTIFPDVVWHGEARLFAVVVTMQDTFSRSMRCLGSDLVDTCRAKRRELRAEKRVSDDRGVIS